MDTKTINLWIPGKMPGMNEIIAASKIRSGSKYNKYAVMKKRWTEYIMRNLNVIIPGNSGGDNIENKAPNSAIKGSIVGKAYDSLGPCITFDYAWFDFIWVEENKRRDPDNVAAGGKKLIFDSLVKAGVIANDGWKNIAGWTDSFVVGAPGVEIEIKEVADVRIR